MSALIEPRVFPEGAFAERFRESQQPVSPLSRIPLSQAQLSIVVTVYSGTYSIHETMATLLARDPGYLKEVILSISRRASNESLAICRECAAQDLG